MKPLISILTDEESTVLVYRCVYKCVECIGNWNDPAKWNEVDDVLEDIMTRIPIESDNRCVAIIFLFILKLITLPMKRQKNFEQLVDFEHLDNVIKASKMSNEKRRQLFNDLRNTFKNHHNLLIARWSKRLIEIYQDRDIFGKPEDIRFQIYVCSFESFHFGICFDHKLVISHFQSGHAYCLHLLFLRQSTIHGNELAIIPA